MITMPDPARTVERSAAVCRRYGASRYHAYRMVEQVTYLALKGLDETGATGLDWLYEVHRIAVSRGLSVSASESVPGCSPDGEFASNAR